MIIGLDGSRAFLRYRTGIEEYSYQVIRHLREALPKDAQVRIYVRKKIAFKNRKLGLFLPAVDFPLPQNWQLVGLWAPRFWTQVRLSLEMLLHPVDALLIPAHTVPVIHPPHTVVVVHGLEYEMSPQSYSLWERLYMRSSIRFSVKAAKNIICVSENTAKDLENLYQVPRQKITVIHEGFIQRPIATAAKTDTILFVGRLEERKNVKRIIKAFEILKDTYHLPHTLLLVGKPGYGYESIEVMIRTSPWRSDIQELGYVGQDQKDALFRQAAVFVFPSLYEGFGLPLLEAQSFGIPVLTSTTSSLPEVAGEGAIYADPQNSEDIAEKLYEILTFSPEQREELIQRGEKNLTRFSWEKCAEHIGEVLEMSVI